MIDNESVAVHTFLVHILTSLSEDEREIQIVRYVGGFYARVIVIRNGIRGRIQILKEAFLPAMSK